MRLFYLPIASWACLFILLRGVRSAPELAFPVNSQVPPVAYALQPYQFTFSDSTFRSNLPTVSYTLTDAPQWLSLDSNSRSLGGNPAPSDVGASTFQLRASDGQGDASSEVTLVVLQRPNIALGKAILSDLEAAGSVSAPSTLLVRPLQPFSITFSADVFSGTSTSTTYYATSANNSPLPPWIQLDPSRLSFSGTSPPLRSPSEQQQFYGVSLIASDVPGFSEASVTFYIAVAYRSLVFSPTILSLDVSQGTDFKSSSLRESLKLDSNPIKIEELASVSADLPTWVSLDASSIVLSGKVPDDFSSTLFIVGAIDIYGDTANVTIKLQANGTKSIMSDQSLRTTALIGKDFSYTLPTSIVEDSEKVSIDSGASGWLHFSADNFTLHGKVPKDVQPQDLTINLSASGSENITYIQLIVHLVQSKTVASTSVLTTTSPARTTRLPAPTEQNGTTDKPSNKWRRGKYIIVLASVIPALAVLFSISIFCFCLRKRSRRREKGKGKDPELHSEPEDQGPIDVPPHGLPLPDTVDLPPIAASSRKSSSRSGTPIQAPQVDIPWAPDSLQKTKERMSKKLQKRKLGSFDSSWSGLVTRPETRTGPGQNTHEPFEWQLAEPSAPPPVPVLSAKRQSGATKASSIRKSNGRQERVSKVLSTKSNRQVGLPQRRSGAGHGGGILTAESAPQRSSWQTTLGSIPRVESRPSTVALDSFPAPPSDGKENQSPGKMTNVTKPSLRLVEPSSEASESFDIQRQKWHTERARDRLEGVARFSNAGSARSFSLPRVVGGPSRTMSPTIQENEIFGTHTKDPSWSKWSGIGPTGRAESPMSARAPPPLFAPRATHRLARDVSITSSGQFDSALSSESQWDDENLIAEVNEEGERQWHTDTESAAPSPRLPFEVFSSSQEEVTCAKQVGTSRGARLVDKRRHVSVEDGGVMRSEKSRVGSFRFI